MPKAKTEFRSTDALSRALEVVGDKWTLALIRAMARDGRHTYQDLLGAAEGIPTNILAARLKRLCDLGLVEKRAYQERPLRYEYHLTLTGRGLEPAIRALEHWGQEALGGLRAARSPDVEAITKVKVPEADPPAPPPKVQQKNQWRFGPEDRLFSRKR